MGWMSTFFSHPAVLVGIGGALGSNARYWLGRWFKSQPWAQDYFWGTFTINLSGSLLLGIIAILCRDRSGAGFLLFGTGFCGGYTTFSTFSMEVTEFIHKGRWDLAGIYMLTSFVGGFLCFLVAYYCTGSIVPNN
jgi:fluoride exporter